MDRIRMPLSKSREVTVTFRDAFREFVVDATARGLSPKTIRNYEHHFHSVSKHMDVDVPLGKLNRNTVNEMVVSMRDSGLSHNSISSYTRVVGTFLRWCDKLGYCHVEMPAYRQQETIKETYTDEELKRLLKPPEKTCRFSIYRTWVIINFLLNSGCRASTVRNILNSDVDLAQQQVFFRHTKNRKVQVIPLCTPMVKILQEYMSIRGGEPEDYLFCDEFGQQISENALRLAVGRFNNSRGVQKTSIHLFRHTFARKYWMMEDYVRVDSLVQEDRAMVLIARLPEGVTLHPREREILYAILDNKKRRDIAEELSLSENTVKTHTRNLYKKLGVANRQELYALIQV